MRRVATAMRVTAALGAAMLTLGFVVFVNYATRSVSDANLRPADGIVVLTGAERRIDTGVRLLRDGLGHRLLISGVNVHNKPEYLLRLVNPDDPLFDCCIDLGYDALDTVGNADETKAWAAHHGFNRLIVVTSSYHMLRSLAELGRVMPDVELVARPVSPRALHEKVWWFNASTMRILVGEYIKLLPSAARFVVSRLTGSHPARTAIAHPSSLYHGVSGAMPSTSSSLVGGTLN